ncbi:MAG: cache domain-containing protein, partial [Ktedonobacteraceae bacterium]|nr:cache domain-containing protein [Ktedonobacteraceae bacterium]
MFSEITTSRKRRVSLSVYLSLLLVLTAIIPLLVAISSILIFLRPALISQISADMERDAQTNIQLTDTYLSERLNDIKTLSEAPAVKDTLANAQAHRGPVSDLLFNVLHRDISNYISLSLLNPQGNLVLSYPAAPLAHGKYLIEPEALQQMQQTDEIVFSDVFYDPVANNPSVDLYVRVIDNNFQTLGYVRASLGLHRIWQAVDSEPRTNGSDSYAFVLDQHGVRIAYTNPD